MLFIPFIYIFLGIGALFWGAEWLVRGASQLALRLGISPLVVGLTVVSLSTSMPEAVASFFGQVKGASGDIAVGNVLGSNMANIGLIAGITAIVAPIPICSVTLKRETPLMILATFLTAGFMINRSIGRFSGFLLLMTLIAYLVFQYFIARKQRRSNGGGKEGLEPLSKEFFYVCTGMLLLILGGYFLVGGAVDVARYFDISERVIGITIIAAGTSCPELATSIMAAWKGHSEIAIGNVVGSNIFNMLFVLGGVSLLMPIEFSPALLRIDMPMTLVFSVGFWIFMYSGKRLSRVEGTLLSSSYAIYLAWLCYFS